MDSTVGIGEFSKMSYLSVKALRHYHDVGILVPAAVDPKTGYRRYTTGQVPVAHAIRRFRELEMPIDEIRLVLQSPDTTQSDRAILRHLERMQQQLEQTQQTVASLQAVLGGRVDDESEQRVEFRHLPSVRVLADVATVRFDDCADWLEGTLVGLHARAENGGLEVVGADGALYADAFFESSEGEVTAFLPVGSGGTDELGGVNVALLVHDGPLADIDRTYGALGTIVAERGISGPGPIREHYLGETVTEVCWPVTGDVA